MKRMMTFALFAFIGPLAAAPAPPIPATDQSQLLIVLKEVQAQQLEIAANQAKIDEKLATLAETIRVARIYSSRGGH